MKTKREHDAWLRVQQDAGWRYGETYDEAAKTDPGMVPYENLTFEDGAAIDVIGEQPVEDTDVADGEVDENIVEGAREAAIEDMAAEEARG